ncbi:MAG TPA: PRC-barrel domain-containing protein [Thermodesulfobacteriota bacterium]|nr:PRC-barrel domain-containing protein [Thermodesulfobacteriota bacterium]
MNKIIAVLAVLALAAFSATAASAAVSMDHPFQIRQFIGKEVRGMNGETLGTIQDFVTSSNGNIQYALLSTSDQTGRLVAVPFQALNSGRDMSYFTLNATRDQLRNAPMFSMNDLNNPAWNQQMYRYYGVQPLYGTEPSLSHDYPSAQARGLGYPGSNDSAYRYGNPDRVRLPDQDTITGQSVPYQQYHNQMGGYTGLGNPGEQGLWGSVTNQAPNVPDTYKYNAQAPRYTYPVNPDENAPAYGYPAYNYPPASPSANY